MPIYNLQILKEAYFGNTKEIQELQSALTDFRARCFRENKLTKKENTYEELFKFNRKAEEVFGFKVFALSVDMATYANAYTIPVSMNFDVMNPKKHFKPSNKKEMKYSKDAGYSCMVFITYGLLMDQRYTDREIMAIILHEIGHNFATILDKNSCIFTNIQKALYLASIVESAVIGVLEQKPDKTVNALAATVQNFNSINSVMLQIDEFITKKFPYFTYVADTMTYVFNFVFGIIGQVLSYVNILSIFFAPVAFMIAYVKSFIAVLMRYNPINLLRINLNYNNEKISDTIPTLYGYSTDIASALTKIEYSDKATDGVLQLGNMVYLPLEILAKGASPHPETITRLKQQMTYLERELDRNNYDAKITKEIKSQISEIEKIIDRDILKPARIKDYKDNQIYSKMYVAYMYRLCGGDLRELYIKADHNKQIDDVYLQKIKDIQIK
ncbi:MAG: hypothetical protein ACRDD7_13720 [Peptostreptococcaceae bacterium]